MESLLTHDSSAVLYAGARDPSDATALRSIQKSHVDRLHIVKLVSASEADAKAVAELIKSREGRVDVVIANAGKLSSVLSTCCNDNALHNTFQTNIKVYQTQQTM